MKRNILTIAILTVLTVTFTVSAVENPNVSSSRNTRNRNTVPSANQSMRLAPQTQYGKTGNDIVTGNVAGNRYFRGVVPYGSSYYSGSNSSTGTASVERFMQRSTSPIVSDRNPGQVRSYYQPERTVSSLVRNGGSGLSKPTLQSQGQGWSRPKPTTHTPYSEYRPRPLSSNDLELQKMVEQQVMLDTAEKLNREKNKTQETTIFDQSLKPEEIEALKKQNRAEQDKTEELTQEEKIKLQLQDLEEQQQLFEQQQAETAADEEKDQTTSDQQQQQEGEEQDEKTLSDTEKMLLQAEGRRILGKHKTYTSLAEEKYSQYLLAAQQFIKDGQFYKATDTYRLAAIWLPDDPRAYLGQSFTLFAAGEYMSSAFYLSEAVKRSPELVARPYNLPKLIGSRDTYENRLVEMATWQQRSGSGELAFLTAYILFQDGKYERAETSIRQAAEVMGDNPAVEALAKIIQSNAK